MERVVGVGLGTSGGGVELGLSWVVELWPIWVWLIINASLPSFAPPPFAPRVLLFD